MPELSEPKIMPDIPTPAYTPSAIPYAELQVATNFSFLRGASHPEELVARAAEVGSRAIAITDWHSLAGIVRAKTAAKDSKITMITGCRIELSNWQLTPPIENQKSEIGNIPPVLSPQSLLLYPTTRPAYGQLCRMLTLGKRRAEKGECHLTFDDLPAHTANMLAIALPPPHLAPENPDFEAHLAQLKALFDDDRLSLAASHFYDAHDHTQLARLLALSTKYDIPLVATNDVHYHAPHRRPLQDVITCIRLGCRIDHAGFALFPNAERHIKSPEEMQRLFRDLPRALTRTVDIAERASHFNLNQVKYEYPHEVCPPGISRIDHLKALTYETAKERWPRGIPPLVQRQLEEEFTLIEGLNYPAYFLTVYDIVRFAKSRGILCQGRGAAANSAVCYCLGITCVDPATGNLLLQRFISKERDEPPDIDIDFEHERREEVIQYIYKQYGRERAALTAEVITYRRRSAIRDVGKALGLSLDCVDQLAKAVDWWHKDVASEEQLKAMGLNPNDKTIRQAITLATEILGFPRHLSQHVGGFVISNEPLCEIVPIENAAMPDRTVIEWDKNDIDDMGMFKVDVLGLGMLTAIRKMFELVNQHHQPKLEQRGCYPLALYNIPKEDPETYEMLCRADSVGVFQVESRAQMTMLPRMKPKTFYDLVVEVAIVRPGPIQGGMVHPYLRRRNGEEAIDCPEPLKPALGRTFGVPIFQEQVMQIAMIAAGFTGGEADQLRRAMASWKRNVNPLNAFGTRIMDRMKANGYTPEFAERVFSQIKGFGEYGFPESHAASFAHLVYVSSWIKKHFPAAFCAALVNSQPMGFYQPAQLVRDAQEHGVKVLPVDVNLSQWDCTLESPPSPLLQSDSPQRHRGTETHRENALEIVQAPSPRKSLCEPPCLRASVVNPLATIALPPAIRLGMRLVKSFRQPAADAITAAVAARQRPFDSIATLWRSTGIKVSMLRALAEADAFGSMYLNRQGALWAISTLRDAPLPMFDALDALENETAEADGLIALPAVAPHRAVVYDYASLGLSLKAHPVSFMRKQLDELNVICAADLKDPRLCPHGRKIAVAGLALVRQRPGTASGIIFITLEDETGVANLVVRPHIYERHKRALRHSVGMIAWGKVERAGDVIHVLVVRAKDLRDAATTNAQPVASVSRNFH